MLSNTGHNLSVLIIAETGQNWETFATWYSVFKNLPDARVGIVCLRTKETPFVYFQWSKRLNVPTIHRQPFADNKALNWLDCVRKADENKMTGPTMLLMRPLTVVTDALDEALLDRLNTGSTWLNEDVWFLKDYNVDETINECILENRTPSISKDKLCHEAKEEDNPACLVSYKKGCGKWIHTAKGCPFSSAAGFITNDMTVNEHRVISLWKKMVPLYNAVV